MDKFKNIIFILSVFFILILIACQPYTITTPDGFVKLQNEYNYDYRAVSADNSIIAIKYHDNDEEGTLEFWYKVLVNYFTFKKAYKFLESKNLKSANSIEGKGAIFETIYNGIRTKYFIFIFVTKDKVYSLEYTAKADNWDKDFKILEKTIQSMTVD